MTAGDRMDGICASLSVVKLVSYGFARGSREATVTVMLELNRVLVLTYESVLESPSNTLGGVIQELHREADCGLHHLRQDLAVYP